MCFSQEKPTIMESTIYSLKDTVGVNFSEKHEMEKWLWYKRNYDQTGKLIEEIFYPFPHNPSSYITTKIKRIEEKGDTIITTILSGEQKIASQTKCYQKNKLRKCVSYKYASLTSSYFKKLDPYYITTNIQDSIKNKKIHITVSTDGIAHDTIKYIMQPLINKSKPNYHQQVEFIKTYSINHKAFNSYGYIIANNDDTLCISSTIEYAFDVYNEVRENIYFDLENNSKRKTVTTFQNDLVKAETKYYLTSEGWEISNITTKEYNQNSDIKLKIRDDYRNGEFSYRYVTYFEYKYYE